MLEDKAQKLKAILQSFDSALVGYSGGVDSSLLLYLAKEALGDKVLAVTVRSVAVTPAEVEQAQEMARRLGVRHRLAEADLLAVPDFANNTEERCYACKLHVFGRLREMAAAEGLAVVLDGTNADDTGDYRPGLAAARQLGVRSPLQEAGLTKSEVRELSRGLGLPTWDKPAAPCLATRLPYGTPVTPERLQQIGKAESILQQMGYRQVRVRHHGTVARIEVPVSDMPRLVEQAEEIVRLLQAEAQFPYVTLDLKGFRSGSMNELLAKRAGSADAAAGASGAPLAG